MAAQKPNKQPDADSPLTYPYPNATARLHKYEFNQQLFLGQHFDAFQVKIRSEAYTKEYAKLRWTVANFAGLLSKVSADMLFSEPPAIKLPVLDKDNPYNVNEGDEIDPNANADATADVFTLKVPQPNPNQEWLENLIFDNRLDVQLYESALTNSYKGDAVFKLRVGQLHDPEHASVIIEQVMPDYYFPDLDDQNVGAEPKSVELSFEIEIGDKQYVRKEIHTPGHIRNELWLLQDGKIMLPAPLELLGIDGLQEEEETGINRLLVVHVPNWSDGTTHFGYDDYSDLVTLLYALDNRLTKIDHILDKHADPILAIPDGVLDEDGNINRSQLGVFEKGEDGDKPEYIVWDAKLESSFQEISEVLQALYMYSETSPSVFGQQSGTHTTQESGRALKYRLMRTVAKIKRKQRYYDYAIKEIVYLAQMLAKAHGLPCNGVAFSGEPEIPSIEWADPIPQDSYEQAQEEELRIASGNQSLKDSIKNIDGLDDEQAVQKIQEIYAEQKQLSPAVSVPVTTSPTGEPAPGGEPNAAVPGQARMKNVVVPQTTKPANANL